VYSNSTQHRANDLEDLLPDFLAHPVIGRGFGTIEPDAPLSFRINDDEYLDEMWQVGIVGLLAYLWMILAPVISAHRAIRTRALPESSLALAAAGGCVAYLVASALFDAFSFSQAPYMFFMVAALATIAAAGPEGNVRPYREVVREFVRPRGPVVATS
jgi:O-antigen ligase